MEAQRKIKASYKYDHAYNAASVKVIMKILATADKQRNRTAVLVPKVYVNMVTDKLQ